MESWADDQRRTAKLVRACYDTLLPAEGPPRADELYALCKLTWLTKGAGEVTDNTAAVVAPALSTLLGIELAATSPEELARELRRHRAPDAITKLAAHPIGLVNYYSGFRNIAADWLREHRDEVWAIMREVAEAKGNPGVRRAYGAIDDLAALPRPGGGDGKPRNLITPLLACLERRGHAPIINGRKIWLLEKLGLSSGSVAEQYDGLVHLIGQVGIKDAFDLDVADEDDVERALRKRPRNRPKLAGSRAANSKPQPPAKRLAERDDEDVEYLRSTDPVTMRRVHNRTTNALRSFCKMNGLEIEEGTDQACLFDALIRRYKGTERHLLIEVKTDDAPAMCRVAVGQLLDYRRLHEDRAAIDLAVLFPSKPRREAIDLLEYVGVKVVWFDQKMTRVDGDEVFDGSG